MKFLRSFANPEQTSQFTDSSSSPEMAAGGEEVAEWQSGKVAKWQSGRVAKWQSGRVAEWQSGKVANLIRFVRITNPLDLHKGQALLCGQGRKLFGARQFAFRRCTTSCRRFHGVLAEKVCRN